MSRIFVGLRNCSSGRGTVYREYLLSCAESGKKLGVLLRPVSPAASNRAGYSAPFWLGVTISRESCTFLDLIDLRLLAGFSMGGPDAPPP